MVDSYINDKGKTVKIAEMPDAYLLNSYAKQKKRLKEIFDKLETNPSLRVYISSELSKLDDLLQSMAMEISKRQLI